MLFWFAIFIVHSHTHTPVRSIKSVYLYCVWLGFCDINETLPSSQKGLFMALSSINWSRNHIFPIFFAISIHLLYLSFTWARIIFYIHLYMYIYFIIYLCVTVLLSCVFFVVKSFHDVFSSVSLVEFCIHVFSCDSTKGIPFVARDVTNERCSEREMSALGLSLCYSKHALLLCIVFG